MTLNIRTAAEMGRSAAYKFFLYGHSGTGKTHCASTAPRPLILLTEKNGEATLQFSNPAAGVAYARNMDEVREVTQYVQSGQAAKDGYQSLVVDGLTDLQRLIVLDVTGGKTEEMTLKHWGAITTRMRSFVMWLRDIPDLHSVATALAEVEKDEVTGKRYVCPKFMGKVMPDEVPGYFSVVGYCFKREAGQGRSWNGTAQQQTEGEAIQGAVARTVEHLVAVEGPDGLIAKPCGPLTGLLRPDISEWVRILSDTPAAPVTNANGKATKSTSRNSKNGE